MDQGIKKAHGLFEGVLLASDFDNTILKNGTAELSDILNILPGPDFPTGGIVINKSDLYEIYNTGMGKIKLRGKIQLREEKRTDLSSLKSLIQ